MRPLLVAVLLVSCGTSIRDTEQHSHGLPDGLQYQIRVDNALTRMWVRTCFDGQPPDRLEPMNSRAVDLLVEAYGDQGQELRIDRDAVMDLDRLATGDCVRYEIDLERAGWSRHAVRREDDLMLTQVMFMWRPHEWDPAVRISVEFDVPASVFVSNAWPRDEHGVYHPERSVLHTVGNVAFLRRAPLRFDHMYTEVEVARLAGDLDVSDDVIQRWVQEAVRSAATLYGKFHKPRLHVAVVPVGNSFRPVAFGLVRRGGGPSVMLLVHKNAEEGALVRDWTATHEFTHLGLPRMYSEDRWIAEGFATYYQEVLRARSGLITPEQAWGSLARGFERGRYRGTRRPLWEDALGFRSVGRIYWAGTAYMLDADLRLRQQGSSLDRAIEAFQARWQHTKTAWHGRRVTRGLDMVLGEDVCADLAEEYGGMRRYPDTDSLLERLGVSLGPDGNAVFNDNAPLAEVRRAITAPRAN